MKKIILVMSLVVGVAISVQSKTEKGCKNLKENKMEVNQKSDIKKLLLTYRDALNTSDVSKVLTLYTENGVFMPSGAPTSIGMEQVKGAYEFVFSNIQLSIEFYIDEIKVVGEYAFARTTSKGTTLIHATGENISEENREIFVLKKEGGAWKIDRYMFNKMK